MADHDHRRTREIGLARDDAAIVQIAVEHRRFARVEVPAHGGMDAVGADQEIAFRLARRLPGRIDEVRDDLVAALLEARELMAGGERARTEALADGAEQNLLQLAARDRDLRPQVAGSLAARLGPDQLAVPVVEGELGGEDAGGGELVAEPERRELAHRVGLQVDPVAERDRAAAPTRRCGTRRRSGAG